MKKSLFGVSRPPPPFLLSPFRFLSNFGTFIWTVLKIFVVLKKRGGGG